MIEAGTASVMRESRGREVRLTVWSDTGVTVGVRIDVWHRSNRGRNVSLELGK